MFHGIDTIPWSDLKHAYGSARDVPLWLHQLTSRDERVRRQAMNHLGGSICHQGWICPATAYVVPYLLELLQEPTIQEKEEILDLLAEIASADPFRDEDWRKGASVAIWEVPAHIPFKDARLEVSNGLSIYVQLLDDSNLEVRMQAANVLKLVVLVTPDATALLAPDFQASLITRLRCEPELTARANLAILLGVLPPPAPEIRAFFAGIRQTSEDDLMIFCATLALAHIAKEETPEEIVQSLASVLLQPPEKLEAYLQLPCSLGASWRAAALVLSNVGSERLQFLIPALQEELPQADRWRMKTLAEMFLFICFTREPREGHKQWTETELTEQQRAILFLIIDQKGLFRGEFTDMLGAYGLPDSWESMGKFLGRELPLLYQGFKPVEVVRFRPGTRSRWVRPSQASRRWLILRQIVLFFLFGTLVFIFLKALFLVLFMYRVSVNPTI